MAKDATAKAGLFVGAAAGITAAIALSRKAKAAEPSNSLVLDDATRQLLEAIAAGTGASLTAIEQILKEIKGMSFPAGGAAGVVPNADEVVAGRGLAAAINTAYRLPELEIPDDMEVQLKGWPTNAGIIFVASLDSAARNINSVWPLLPNEAIGYKIKNLNAIYFSGTVAGDWLAWTVEHRK